MYFFKTQYLAIPFAILMILSEVSTETLVEYYENLIINQTVSALQYQLPEDASRYQPENDTILDFGTYDFIIIGAGAAGSVIANRMSEVKCWKVLLLEAGTFPNNFTDIPSLYAVSCFSDYNWGYKTVPQTTACLGTVDQRCIIPRGRGLGGTTLINGLIYSRGHEIDFNKWAQTVNDNSWIYENLLPYYKKSEDFNPTDPEAPVDYAYHGTGGYWNVEHHLSSIQLKYAFLDANAELGFNFTDYIGPQKLGGVIPQYNSKKGRRHDQGTAFILPILHRKNLKVSTESYVTKVEINKITKVATGVLFTHKGQTYRAKARKEVIVSAGAIASPKILMLSGIGPQKHLKNLGIPVIRNLPVGRTLRDHTALFGLEFTSNMTRPSSTLRQQVEEYINGEGPLTSNIQSNVIGWYQSNAKQTPNYPDLEMVLDISPENSALGQIFLNWNDETWNALWGNHTTTSFYLMIMHLHTKSVGTVKLKSSNPFDYPLIDSNLLSDPENHDIDALYDSINFCLKLVNTTAFREAGARLEARPLPACNQFEFLSKEYWYCFIRHLSIPIFHPVGTCPTGTDPSKGAVVDSNLKVFGLRNLRVADASVFPFTLSSHSTADCAMIGDKISDVIKAIHWRRH